MDLQSLYTHNTSYGADKKNEWCCHFRERVQKIIVYIHKQILGMFIAREEWLISISRKSLKSSIKRNISPIRHSN